MTKKPRIKWVRAFRFPSRFRNHGAWICIGVLPGDEWFGECSGKGKTPQEAYINWKNYLEIPF